MATEIPAHADTTTKEGHLWWERWAAVGDARDVVLQQRQVVGQLKARWGACRRQGLVNGRTCACGKCEARVRDALDALVHAVAQHKKAIAVFKGDV